MQHIDYGPSTHPPPAVSCLPPAGSAATPLSPDTIVPEPTLAIDYNRYLYARADPLNLVDPSGHLPEFVNGGCSVGLYCQPTYASPQNTILPAISVTAPGIDLPISFPTVRPSAAAFSHLLPDTYVQGLGFEISVLAGLSGERAQVWDARNNMLIDTSSFGGGLSDPNVSGYAFAGFGTYHFEGRMDEKHVTESLQGVSLELEAGGGPSPVAVSAAYGTNVPYASAENHYSNVNVTLGLSGGLPAGGHLFWYRTHVVNRQPFASNAVMAQSFLDHQRQLGLMNNMGTAALNHLIAAYMRVK